MAHLDHRSVGCIDHGKARFSGPVLGECAHFHRSGGCRAAAVTRWCARRSHLALFERRHHQRRTLHLGQGSECIICRRETCTKLRTQRGWRAETQKICRQLPLRCSRTDFVTRACLYQLQLPPLSFFFCEVRRSCFLHETEAFQNFSQFGSFSLFETAVCTRATRGTRRHDSTERQQYRRAS